MLNINNIKFDIKGAVLFYDEIIFKILEKD
jgi:hypothetical protein